MNTGELMEIIEESSYEFIIMRRRMTRKKMKSNEIKTNKR